MKSRVCWVPSLSRNSKAQATLSLITCNVNSRLQSKALAHVRMQTTTQNTHLGCKIDPHSGVRCKPDVVPCELVAQANTRSICRCLSEIEALNRRPADVLTTFLYIRTERVLIKTHHYHGFIHVLYVEESLPSSCDSWSERRSY